MFVMSNVYILFACSSMEIHIVHSSPFLTSHGYGSPTQNPASSSCPVMGHPEKTLTSLRIYVSPMSRWTTYHDHKNVFFFVHRFVPICKFYMSQPPPRLRWHNSTTDCEPYHLLKFQPCKITASFDMCIKLFSVIHAKSLFMFVFRSHFIFHFSMNFTCLQPSKFLIQIVTTEIFSLQTYTLFQTIFQEKNFFVRG